MLQLKLRPQHAASKQEGPSFIKASSGRIKYHNSGYMLAGDGRTGRWVTCYVQILYSSYIYRDTTEVTPNEIHCDDRANSVTCYTVVVIRKW